MRGKVAKVIWKYMWHTRYKNTKNPPKVTPKTFCRQKRREWNFLTDKQKSSTLKEMLRVLQNAKA